ncbi:MAG: sulfite exporter TauE/SafE family protein [Chloroflexi bacterium]|nr:sulfite exporter TauE/SafE family protein [Chloroflexota bacterium]
MGALSFLQTLVVVLATLAGSTVLASLGFGIGMVATPVLLLVLDPQTAVVMLNAVSVPITGLLVWQTRRHLNVRDSLPIILLGLAGALVGAYVLSTSGDRVLRLSIVVLIILLAAATAFNPARLRGRVPYPKVVGGLIGFFVGVMLGSLAIGGPLLVLFVLSRGWDRHSIRAFLSLYLFVIMVSATVGYIPAGLFTQERTMLTLVALPPALLGFWLGSRLAGRMNEGLFRRVAIGVIVASSVSVLVRELVSI